MKGDRFHILFPPLHLTLLNSQMEMQTPRGTLAGLLLAALLKQANKSIEQAGFHSG